MKERVAFIHEQGEGVDPQLLKLSTTGIQGPSIQAARQDRLNIAYEELPLEVKEVLYDAVRVEVKWASSDGHQTTDPLTARISPGLHAWYSTRKGRKDISHDVCKLLQAFGPLDCNSQEVFTSVHNTDTSEDTFYFYSHLESLGEFAVSATSHLCTGSDSQCRGRLASLSSASSLDLSFDSSLKQAKLSALWPVAERSISVQKSKAERSEVGVMGLDKPPQLEPHELGISGVLAYAGEKKDPSAVLFAFPARHRRSVGSFSAEFVQPTGLHPTLRLSLSANESVRQDGRDGCKPYVYLTLPKSIFADRYQLADALFLASKNLSASPYTSLPVDLEAPAYTTKAWGSSVLLELLKPKENTDWTAEVPLHLRYLEPSETGKRLVELPYPAVFWACKAAQDVDFSTSPFDRSHLGYDGLFEPHTVFWHVNPQPVSGSRLTSSLTVPVLQQGFESYIAAGTSAVIVLGFSWVLWKLVSGFMSHGYQNPNSAATPKKKKTK